MGSPPPRATAPVFGSTPTQLKMAHCDAMAPAPAGRGRPRNMSFGPDALPAAMDVFRAAAAGMPFLRTMPAVPFSVSAVSFQSPSASVPISRIIGGAPFRMSTSKTSRGWPIGVQPTRSTDVEDADGMASATSPPLTAPAPLAKTVAPPCAAEGATSMPAMAAAGMAFSMFDITVAVKPGEAVGSPKSSSVPHEACAATLATSASGLFGEMA
mmetsp:Transcript_17811/g.53615  ORF Transcript_17811/g.53615 Transcript_17811/m.53615 type:complete len:212 (+) Transcript_17811:334-969(+)